MKTIFYAAMTIAHGDSSVTNCIALLVTATIMHMKGKSQPV
jgi:hypothetical protein